MKVKRYSKNYINFFLDIIITISFIIVLASSIILWLILPRGTGTHGDQYCQNNGLGAQGNFFTVLEWPRYIWIDLHNWASVFLLTIIIIHILIHWRWIIEIIKRSKSYFTGPIRKSTEQFVNAVVLLILFIMDSITGFIVWIILPRGSYDYYMMLAGLGRTFLGLQRNIWLDIHVWIAIAILSILAIHLFLNFNWIINVMKKAFYLLMSPIIHKENIN